MRFQDILKYCFANLWRRKIRTILAILGVFIGILSILATVSIGLAMSYNLDRQLQNSPGVRIIYVSPGKSNNPEARGRGPVDFDSQSINDKTFKLDFKAIEKFKKYKHIINVSPVIKFYATLTMDHQYSSSNIALVNPDIIPSILPLVHGQYVSDTSNHIMITKSVVKEIDGINGHYDQVKQKYIEAIIEPDVMKKYVEKGLELTFDNDAGWNDPRSRLYSPRNNNNEPDKVKLKYKNYKLRVDGVLEDKGFWQYNAFIPMKTGLKILKEFYASNIHGLEHLRTQYYEYEYFRKNKAYPQLMLAVDRFENVSDVYHKLKSEGYVVKSQIESLDHMKRLIMYVQLVLGSLGAISLLVAMVGITNTTIMTIYERTREIGIMKVVGARLIDIRNLFLFESGLIGFLGGLLGSTIGLGISAIANYIFKDSNFLNRTGLDAESSNLVSYMPPWLIISAIILATCVGLIAGFFPSRRAMRMSALESLRGE